MYLVINKCVTAVKVSNFSGHYLRNRSTLDVGVLDYIGIVQHKEHSPEVLSIPPGTPCIKALIIVPRGAPPDPSFCRVFFIFTIHEQCAILEVTTFVKVSVPYQE